MTPLEPTLFGVPLAFLNSSATFVNLIYILDGFLHMNSFCFVVLKNFASIKAMRFIERKQSGLHLFLRDCAIYQMQLFCQYKKPTTQNFVTYFADTSLLYTFNACDSAHDTSRNRRMKTTRSHLECFWEGWGDADHEEQGDYKRKNGCCTWNNAQAHSLELAGLSEPGEVWARTGIVRTTCAGTRAAAESVLTAGPPHLVPYPVKLSLSQRTGASQLLSWVLGLIRKQELFQGHSSRT